MPASRLEDIARKTCIKFAKHITDVGDFEYWRVKAILQRIDSPEQLHQIELRSPQIKGEDAELWHTFIARDIPDWQKKSYHPKNPTKWYEIYCKYKREQRREIEKDEEILRQQMGLLQKEKATNVSQVVDLKKLPKLPKDPRMLAQNGGVPLKKGNKGGAMLSSGAMSWGGGSRTKMNGAQGVLLKAKREAKEIHQMSRLSRPTHQLGARPGQITKAPAAMVNDHRKATLPSLKIISRRKDPVEVKETASKGPSLEDREKRLRALTMQKDGAAKVTWVDSSEDDDSGSPGIDDLFDDSNLKSRTATPNSVHSVGGVRSSSSIRSASQTASSPASTAPSTTFSSSRLPPYSKPAPTSISRPTQSRPNLPTPPTSTTKPLPKPSDLITSMISKPKPKPSPSSVQAPIKASTSVQSSRDSSPAGMVRPKGAMPPKGLMPRKRPQEVDVFNRGKKRPRMT